MKRALLLLAACHPPMAAWQPPPAQARGRVILVENHRLPLVAVELVELDGGSREDGAQHGLAALTGDLIARDDIRVDVTTDAAYVEMLVTADRFADAVHALQAAPLDEGRFDAAKAARIAAATEHRLQPRTLAAQAFDRLAFGDHPYAHAAEGDPETLATITLADARAFRAAHAARYAIVVAGDVDAAQLARVLADASPLPVAVAPVPVRPAATAHVDAPGDSVVILAGGRGQAASAPDRVAADVANAMLGGAADSRLDRAFAGMSLAASSSFWRGYAGGTWTIAATVRKPDEARALATLRRELARRDFTADELRVAKRALTLSFPRAFETVAGTARAYARLLAAGVPLDFYARYLARVDATTLADATRAIDGMWRAPSIVTVGP